MVIDAPPIPTNEGGPLNLAKRVTALEKLAAAEGDPKQAAEFFHEWIRGKYGELG
jgi:hypothetical protein